MSAAKESLVTIVNKRRRMKCFNLEGEHMRSHPQFGYKRIDQIETILDPKTGVHRQKRGRASIPRSITFKAMESKPNMPASILQCPEVRDAWKKFGHLKVIFQDKAVKVEASKSAPKKTLMQLQKEAAEDTAKREAEHAKSELGSPKKTQTAKAKK